jgi:hypothetical protein
MNLHEIVLKTMVYPIPRFNNLMLGYREVFLLLRIFQELQMTVEQLIVNWFVGDPTALVSGACQHTKEIKPMFKQRILAPGLRARAAERTTRDFQRRRSWKMTRHGDRDRPI